MSAGGAAKRQSERNRIMAAYMAKMGIMRRVMRCPINHRHLIGTESALINHLNSCSHR